MSNSTQGHSSTFLQYPDNRKNPVPRMRLHEFPHHRHQLLGSRCLASLSNIYFLEEIKQNLIETSFAYVRKACSFTQCWSSSHADYNHLFSKADNFWLLILVSQFSCTLKSNELLACKNCVRTCVGTIPCTGEEWKGLSNYSPHAS